MCVGGGLCVYKCMYECVCASATEGIGKRYEQMLQVVVCVYISVLVDIYAFARSAWDMHA